MKDRAVNINLKEEMKDILTGRILNGKVSLDGYDSVVLEKRIQ